MKRIRQSCNSRWD